MAVQVDTFIVGMVETNCYILSSDSGETVVFDPGDRGEEIYERLEKRGLHLTAIVLTHGHFDHILGVEALRRLSSAPVYAPEAEKITLSDPEVNLSSAGCTVEADRYLKDGETLHAGGITFRCILTPGHTAGSMCYYAEEEKLLFSGDTLFEGAIGRSDLPGGSGSRLLSSIREKLLVLPDDTIVYPGHGGRTTIGDERQYNPFL